MKHVAVFFVVLVLALLLATGVARLFGSLGVTP